ncbi:hypothetical protein RCZ04_04580 [Capnocytophaga sp. HP1101]
MLKFHSAKVNNTFDICKLFYILILIAYFIFIYKNNLATVAFSFFTPKNGVEIIVFVFISYDNEVATAAILIISYICVVN